MISQQQVDQAFTDLRATCGGLREDYFGLLYLEREHGVPREKALNCVAFGGNDYGVDGFHFDKDTPCGQNIGLRLLSLRSRI
jgi:hypothetical protein